MPDTGSNPFAEPDFSALKGSGGEDDVNDYEDAEDEDDEFEDGDDLDDGDEDDVEENEDLEGTDEPSVRAQQLQEADEDAVGNRVAGGTARSVLEHVARSIVDDPDGVAVEVSETRSGIHLALHVSQSDMGRIIGRRGRTAQALRTLVRAAAAHDSQEASVDIVD